ncbi:MAG: GNAT family N-acetyltransferase [Pseudomonas sp.]
MKEYLAAPIRKLISPSVRFKVRERLAWLRDMLGRACFWRWEIARFKLRQDSPYDIIYIGRKTHRDTAKVLMGVELLAPDIEKQSGTSDRRVVVSEIPTLGALYVPHLLSAIVPLGRPIEDITSKYNSELRRNLRKNQPRYRMKQALTDEEIDRADREMLQPYASARHGATASQIASHEVFRLAKTSSGRLDLVLLDDQVVACHLGCVINRNGKRYWSTVRFGYPEAVFSDTKKLREVNSITTFMALEWAIANGFDYYDIGTCLARPDDGLLEWKRRRGGDVDTLGNHAYMFVRLPKVGAAQLLWDTPLFAVEGKDLTLHLGLPDGPNDEEVANRYREMGFGGLFKIYLYCARTPSEPLLDTLRSRYAHLKSPPIVESVLST